MPHDAGKTNMQFIDKFVYLPITVRCALAVMLVTTLVATHSHCPWSSLLRALNWRLPLGRMLCLLLLGFPTFKQTTNQRHTSIQANVNFPPSHYAYSAHFTVGSHTQTMLNAGNTQWVRQAQWRERTKSIFQINSFSVKVRTMREQWVLSCER